MNVNGMAPVQLSLLWTEASYLPGLKGPSMAAVDPPKLSALLRLAWLLQPRELWTKAVLLTG